MASAVCTAGCAWVDGGRGGTPGFQPVMFPDSDAKMNRAAPDDIPECTTNPSVPLKTWPVGSPPGMPTTSEEIEIGVFFRPPEYRLATSAPLSATHSGVLGPAAMPQGLTRLASVTWASPGRSDTRFVCR